MEGQQTEAAMPEPIEVGGSSMRPHDQTHNNAAQPLNNDADQPNGPSSTTSSNASTLVQQTENPSGPDTSAGGASRPQMDPRESVSFQPNAQSQVQAPKIAHRPTLKRQETKLAQKNAHPMEHLGITLGLPAIILFDLVVPCIIYYEWYNRHRGQWDDQCRPYFEINTECPIPFKGYDTTILGSAIASFGVGELWIWLARSYRLLRRPDDCAPLLSRSRWELDATSWVYLVSMVLALVGFLVGSSRDIPKLYLYSPSILMAFLGLLMAVTAFAPFTLPIGINSHARGSKLRPFIYYAAEDFIAVDGLQDREFRIRYNERYETNRVFRRLFFDLTLWWILGVCVYIGAVSAVIWTLPFHIAFGLSFGVLFGYIAIWAASTVLWVNREMEREHKLYMAGKIEP